MNWTLQVILILTISNVLAVSIKRSKSEKLLDNINTDAVEDSSAHFDKTSRHVTQINIDTENNSQQDINNKLSIGSNKTLCRHRTNKTEQNIKLSDTDFYDLEEGFEFLQSRGQKKSTEHKYLKSSTREDYQQISLPTDEDAKIKNSVTSVKKINKRVSSSYRKGALTRRKNVRHNPTQKNESPKGRVNEEIPTKDSIIETVEDRDFLRIFPRSQVSIKNDNLFKENVVSKTISPKQFAVPDVLDVVLSEATSIHGFSAGISIEKNSATTPVDDVQNSRVRNYQISSNEGNITARPHNSHIEITSQSNFKMKQDKFFENKDHLNGPSKDIFEARQTIKQPLVSRNKVIELIDTEPTSKDEHYEVIRDIRNKGMDNKNNDFGTTLAQNEEDELHIQNAKYAFSSSQKDGISDLLHDRMETREGEKVTGSYSYSDGFFLIKVNYIADKDGYRILSEQKVALPGNGPQTNPHGVADIITNIDGHSLHYVVHGEDIVSQQQRFRYGPRKA